MLGKFAQHGLHLGRCLVREHALQHHQHGLAARALGQAQGLPPMGLTQVDLGLVVALALQRQALLAQLHHAGLVGVQPVVAPVVKPLKVAGQPATQVGALAPGVALEKVARQALYQAGAREHTVHAELVLQVRPDLGVQPGQDAQGVGVVHGHVGEQALAVRSRGQRNEQRGLHRAELWGRDCVQRRFGRVVSHGP